MTFSLDKFINIILWNLIPQTYLVFSPRADATLHASCNMLEEIDKEPSLWKLLDTVSDSRIITCDICDIPLLKCSQNLSFKACLQTRYSFWEWCYLWYALVWLEMLHKLYYCLDTIDFRYKRTYHSTDLCRTCNSCALPSNWLLWDIDSSWSMAVTIMALLAHAICWPSILHYLT